MEINCWLRAKGVGWRVARIATFSCRRRQTCIERIYHRRWERKLRHRLDSFNSVVEQTNFRCIIKLCRVGSIREYINEVSCRIRLPPPALQDPTTTGEGGDGELIPLESDGYLATLCLMPTVVILLVASWSSLRVPHLAITARQDNSRHEAPLLDVRHEQEHTI